MLNSLCIFFVFSPFQTKLALFKWKQREFRRQASRLSVVFLCVMSCYVMYCMICLVLSLLCKINVRIYLKKEDRLCSLRKGTTTTPKNIWLSQTDYFFSRNCPDHFSPSTLSKVLNIKSQWDKIIHPFKYSKVIQFHVWLTEQFSSKLQLLLSIWAVA